LKDYQSILFPYAYNILGSAEDAKDAVQDVLYKHLSGQQKEVDNEKAYLIKAVINQSINLKEKNKKTQYGDEWLPEPIATEETDKAIQLKPRDATAHYNRGRAKQSKGDLDGALSDYGITIGIKPDLGEAYYNRGIVKQSNRDLKFAFQFRSLGRLVGELIRQRRDAPEQHFDFLSMFMLTHDRETDEPMSDKELIDEVLTLIVAGHETTAAALTWTWYLVSRHPEAAERLRAEADDTGTDGILGLGAAEAMSYTHQVLQESLRLYPPGWLITRRAIEADELGGFGIAPRTDIFISPYMLHRNPAFWSDAEEFRPERFADADANERHKFAYIPFAVGPRHCIGENIAMFEMLVHMRTMMRRFRLERANDEPIELEAQINLRPRSNLMMTVKTR